MPEVVRGKSLSACGSTVVIRTHDIGLAPDQRSDSPGMLASYGWLLRHAKGGLCLRGYAAAASNLQSIKALREKSGAPMSEVKAALEEASWDEGMVQLLACKAKQSPQNTLPASQLQRVLTKPCEKKD